MNEASVVSGWMVHIPWFYQDAFLRFYSLVFGFYSLINSSLPVKGFLTDCERS